MATIEELFDDRTETVGDRAQAEIPYVVTGAADEDEVKSLALTSVPAAYAGLTRKSIVIDERVNNDTWKIVANYEKPEVGGEGGPESVFNFDTGGGTQHITQSIATVSRYGPGASTELGGAIGFDGEYVQGVDITVPVFNFSETHYFPDDEVTLTYKGILFALTGKVNADPFRGLNPGEGLFLGASGSRRGDEDWEITFRFAAMPNKTGITVGDISGIAKKGWEYLWVQYGDSVDAAKKQLIKKPVAVYIEQVYESAFFAALGIGS